jgi:pimeloyl-ACP methyl ester carboxylesterase
LFSDPRFSPGNVRQGVWSPEAFRRRVLGGIYCIDSYDRHRVPVLFIHGIHGSPRDFGLLIERLDRQQLQPCVFFYASGASLTSATTHLRAEVLELRARYGVTTIVIVAHSMGGLIARDLLVNDWDESLVAVPAIVTISTPWSGHAGAGFGARFAPVVVDSWIDLASDSSYIASLFVGSAAQPRKLPASTQHHLIFTYGRGWASLGASDDEVVTLASQLNRSAQEQAQRIYGFDATHAEILHREAMAELLNRILTSTALHPQSRLQPQCRAPGDDGNIMRR